MVLEVIFLVSSPSPDILLNVKSVTDVVTAADIATVTSIFGFVLLSHFSVNNTCFVFYMATNIYQFANIM